MNNFNNYGNKSMVKQDGFGQRFSNNGGYKKPFNSNRQNNYNNNDRVENDNEVDKDYHFDDSNKFRNNRDNHNGPNNGPNNDRSRNYDNRSNYNDGNRPRHNNSNGGYNKFQNNNSGGNRYNKQNNESFGGGPVDKFSDSGNHDNDNEYLDDNYTKQQLLEYVYNTIELSNYKYKLVEYEYDLPLLKEKQYFVSPNYNGIHSLLIFIKIKEKFLSFLIDRKTLTYNIRQIDYNKVKMIPVYFRLDKEIYNGTIFDGVFLYNNINGLKHFVINDVYYFRGKDMSSDKITNKMLNVSTYLETINQDTTENNLVFIINKLYPLNEIQQLVNMYIPKSKYNKSIKGIAFYSEYSGTKLIYLYNNCSREETQTQSQPQTQQTQESHQRESHPRDSHSQTYAQSKAKVHQKPVDNDEYVEDVRPSNVKVQSGASTGIFKMKKTDTIDVYNLFLGEKIVDGAKKLFKYKKVGIAYVPTKECSFFCKDSFVKSAGEDILVECKLDADKNRWIPVKLVTNKKRPDLTDILDGKMTTDS